MKKVVLIISTLLLSMGLLFAGETYETLLDSMLRSNPTLLKAQQETRKADLDVKDARANRGPQINFAAGVSHSVYNPYEKIYLKDVSENAVNVLGDVLNYYKNTIVPSLTSYSSFDQLMNYINTKYGTTSNPLLKEVKPNFVMAQVSLTQPLFTWGKLATAEKIYKDVRLVRQLQETDAQSKAVVELKTRLDSIYYLQNLIKTLEEEDKVAARLVELSEEAYKNGMMVELDVKSARIDALEVKVGINQAQAQLDSVLEGLRTITGKIDLEAEDIEYTPNEEEYRTIASADREALIAEALSPSRSTLRMLSIMSDVAEKKNSVAKNGLYWKPDFALSASVTYAGPGLPGVNSNFFEKAKFYGSFSIGMKTTIFDGGKKINEVARSKSDMALAELERSDAENMIRTTLSSMFSTVDTALSQIDYLGLKKEVDSDKLEQKKILFKHGSGSETDILKAELKVKKHDIDIAKEYINLCQAIYTIEYLTTI
ncbi:MAG: TolC family protein [Sphaerochaetaceae bacterium]|nr:TolC family protein [Sphaerochaetaceae bacterium]